MKTRAALVASVMLFLACAEAPAAPTAVEIPLGQATLITAGTHYAVAGTPVTFTADAFTPLDTQAGHVLTGRVTVSDGGAAEALALHASAVAPLPYPPTEWHGYEFLLSETGFVYHGNTATLTVTRAP